MKEGNAALFEFEAELPDERLTRLAARLVSFTARFDRLRQDLRLLVDRDGLEKWCKQHYGRRLPLLDSVLDRYPLAVFHGDVGTGKTATAEVAANMLTRELKKEARLFKLSTRVRGAGNVGEMSMLINQAFDVVVKEAGRARLAYLIIDEADSLATRRSVQQSHHEDKVAVNTLIQKIDDIRQHNGRVMVFLCTNRFIALDPAIIRRAAFVEEFNRPNDTERHELLAMDCEGLGFSSAEIDELVRLTGPSGRHKLRYTFSDLRTRVIPEALARAFPERKIALADFRAAVDRVAPSPAIEEP